MIQPTRANVLRALTAAAVVRLVCLAVGAGAQESEPSGPALSEAGQAALAEWQETGDPAAAVEILEPHRRSDGTTLVDQALLGTLYLESGRAGDALETLKPLADEPSADAAVLYNAGRAAMAVGRLEEAAGWLERSVRLIPGTPASRELGLLFGFQGRSAEAYRLLRPWVAQNPDDLQARLASIAAALQLGRAPEVEALFEGLPEDDPKILLLRGHYLSQTGDPRGAVEVLEPLVESHPPEMRGDLFRLLGDTYLDVGRSSDTVELLAGEAAADPRLALILAEAYNREGRLEAGLAVLEPFAERALEVAEAKSPNAVQLLMDYGRSLVLMGRAEEALPYLEQASERAPEDKLAWKNLGDALNAVGRREEALEALEKFRSLTQSDLERKRRADVIAQDPGAKAMMEATDAIRAGETEKALELLRREAGLSPQDPRPRLLEVNLLLQLGRNAEALAKAEQTVAAFPGNPDALYQRGVAHLGLKDSAKAEADFRRALEIAPEHTGVMNDLAVLLMVGGRKDEARPLLERVIELRPDNRVAKDNLEKLKAKE